MTTEAQKKAIRNYEKNNIDKITLRLPKGKREEIASAAVESGESINGYIRAAIEERLLNTPRNTKENK